MFHIASRHAQPAFDMATQSHLPASLPALNLPRTLARPAFAEPSRDLVASIEPGLAQVPFEYIRKGLRARGEEYVLSFGRTSSSQLTCLQE